MADVKTLRTRIALLYKTYAEWDAIKDSYKPLKGEVCICEVPAATGAVVDEPAVLIKVGDGEQAFKDLPWISALAADVHAWAKKASLEFGDLDANFIEALDAHIGGKVQDTNTKYQFRSFEDSEGIIHYQLQSKELGGEWVDVEGQVIEIPQFDPAALIARIEALESDLASEIARASAAESANATAISAEVARAQAKEAELQSDIDGEVERATAAEAVLAKSIEDLGRPLHFVGIATKQEGETEAEAIEREFPIADQKIGAVAICGAKEFVAAGDPLSWREFGDVSQYASRAELEAEVARALAAEGVLAEAIEEKQDKLTAGKGIIIEDNTITYDEAEIASVEYVDASISDTMSYVIQEDNEEKAARIAGDNLLDAKKVDKELSSADGKAIIFNEVDGGGAKFENADGTESFVGVNNGGKDGIAAQIYADRLVDGKWQGAKLDVTNGGIYYTVGNASAAERDVEANELATKGDIDSKVGTLADIAHTGMAHDLLQEDGEYLILNCNF